MACQNREKMFITVTGSHVDSIRKFGYISKRFIPISFSPKSAYNALLKKNPEIQDIQIFEVDQDSGVEVGNFHLLTKTLDAKYLTLIEYKVSVCVRESE